MYHLIYFRKTAYLVQIRKSEIYKVVMNFRILKNYVQIKKGIRVFSFFEKQEYSLSITSNSNLMHFLKSLWDSNC